MDNDTTTYDNTSTNAVEVGWTFHPEFCIGLRRDTKFVTHDHVNGVFTFHD